MCNYVERDEIHDRNISLCATMQEETWELCSSSSSSSSSSKRFVLKLTIKID